MIEYKFDPMAMIAQAINDLYPDINVNIYFTTIDSDGDEKVYGRTTFPEEGEPEIDISIETPLQHIPEIIAHEVAHVIAGLKAEHNSSWELEFRAINMQYNLLMNMSNVPEESEIVFTECIAYPDDGPSL